MRPKFPEIPGKIDAFHKDESLDWVADLECGHQHHLRHNPPGPTRHWATTSEGRLEHIGQELPCSLCAPITSKRSGYPQQKSTRAPRNDSIPHQTEISRPRRTLLWAVARPQVGAQPGRAGRTSTRYPR